MSTECVIVAVDESGPGGDKSVEVTARHRVDGGIDILSVRELPQDESHVKCTDPDHHGCPLCTAPADAHLEAALDKLRHLEHPSAPVEVPPFTTDEAAALLAKIEAADRLYNFLLEYCATEVFSKERKAQLSRALATYRNPQPAAEEENS